MNKIEAVHIHTDFKFVGMTERFEGEFFHNTVIVINNSNSFSGPFSENALIFAKSSVHEIVAFCKNADLVVLYDLDILKMRIAMKLPLEVQVAWRFFGYELYGRHSDLFKSSLSRKFDRTSFYKRARKKFGEFYYLLKTGSSKSRRLKNSFRRINYFLGLSFEEYQSLQSLWPDLPNFVKLPHFHAQRQSKTEIFGQKSEKSPLIIIGNNRSSYNNHLDIIDIINSHDSKINYNFNLLFNYGEIEHYAREVLKRVREKDHFSLEQKFLSMDDFEEYYNNASALVINGYRQMAGFNIRMALEKGLKVYLNNKNVHKKFLENHGFRIFSIEDFENDLKHENLDFDIEVAKHNLLNFIRFTEMYTQEDFQKYFFELINMKK